MARAIPEALVLENPPPLSGWVTAIQDDDGTVSGYIDRTTGYPLITAPFLPQAKNINVPLVTKGGKTFIPPDGATEIFE